MLASVSASELDMDWIHLWIAMSRMTVTQFFFLIAYHFDINRKECAVCLIGNHCSTVDYKS